MIFTTPENFATLLTAYYHVGFSLILLAQDIAYYHGHISLVHPHSYRHCSEQFPSFYWPKTLRTIISIFLSFIPILTGIALSNFHDGFAFVVSDCQFGCRIWNHRQQKNDQRNVFLFHRQVQEAITLRITNVRSNPCQKMNMDLLCNYGLLRS